MRLSNGFVLAFHDIDAQKASDLIDSLPPAQVVPLSELVHRSKVGKSTAGLLAITVDDGVGETVRNLSKLFLRRGWPGTFYLCTQYLDTGQGMGFQWWRCVEPFLPRRKLVLKCGTIDLSPRGAVHDFSRKIERLWHTARIETYLPLTIELAGLVAKEYGLESGVLRPPSPISWREVKELSSNPLLSFESHGVSHAAMSTLTDEELNFEMKHSRALIAEHTGRPCQHFAYPFGSDQSIGARAPVIARGLYDSATTMTLGHVSNANPWMLPRIPLYPKNSGLFANVKLFLKCRGAGIGQPGNLASAGAVPESRPGSAV